MSLTPGSRLGAYEIEAHIGAGGMGEVYRARDTRLDRCVALKVLAPSLAGDPTRLERFTREARAVAALNHPHIVTIHSIEEASSVPFLTMELLEGKTLQALIPPGGLPLEQFFDVALPLASALGAAHAKHITHRDLKPANVMITVDHRVKVLDFGLARVGLPPGADHTVTHAPLTQHGTIVGTMPYMSPEQLAGTALDHRSDIFSLGILFYEMLTGSRPFTGNSSPLLMSAILRDAPASITTVRPDVPEALARLIERCLEKRPDDRVQTADEVFAALRFARTDGEKGIGIRSGPAVRPAPVLAVMPFADLSASRDQAWFCDGIAEDVLNLLGQVSGLRTLARGSASRLQAHDDPREIGRALSVTHLLTGSVRRDGERIRVTSQLVSTANGSQLWTDRYDRALADVFEVQDEIARAITTAMTGRLLLGAADRRTPALPAYDAVLRGRHDLFSSFTPESWGRARTQFAHAIALDPLYAEPHAQLGLGYFISGMHGFAPMREVAPEARAAAERALHLDSSDVRARVVRGAIAVAIDHDWTTAEGHFRAAFDTPNVPAEAHWLYASLYLGALGRFGDSVAEMGRAVEKDPLNANWRAIWSAHLTNAGEHARAIAEASRAVELDGSYWGAHHILGEAYLADGRRPEAMASFETALRLAPWNAMPAGVLAAASRHAGDDTRADRLLARIGDAPQPVWGRTLYHLHAGEADSAADWFERMIADGDPFALVYASAPVMSPLHAHPRWHAIVSSLRLPAPTGPDQRR